MKKLTPIPTGEQATLNTTTSGVGKVVDVTFSVKENGEKGTPRYNLTWQFDFEGVTAGEIAKLATRSLRIDGQATWRSAKDKMDADVWQGKKWSVRAMLDQTRQKADPIKKTENAFLALSIAEQTEFIKKHG